MSDSAFAGNPLLISPEGLVRAGWLEPGALESTPPRKCGRVHYGEAAAAKEPLLRKAFEGFVAKQGVDSSPFQRFREQHAYWLEDYALYLALKRRFGDRVWSAWPRPLANCDDQALASARAELTAEIRFHEFVQFVFSEQWNALRNYCDSLGLELIGDLPLYVSYDSSDVWANRAGFQLDADNQLPAVAGVPPDYFSASGQRWGNPLYRWQALAADGFQWWVERLWVNFQRVSRLRLDHFRGYEAYWEVPSTDLDTTRNGSWVKGPGADFFDTVETALRKRGLTPSFIAEDLGVITPEVDDLRDRLGYPGMRILQMAFGDDPKASEYLPHHHIRNCVVYTATHDHNTTSGWFTAEPGTQTAQSAAQVERERRHALAYLGTDGSDIHWDMIRLALGSVADTAIVPLQDVLGLPSCARMNLPGTLEGNWEWRFTWEMLDQSSTDTLTQMTEVFERA